MGKIKAILLSGLLFNRHIAETLPLRETQIKVRLRPIVIVDLIEEFGGNLFVIAPRSEDLTVDLA